MGDELSYLRLILTEEYNYRPMYLKSTKDSEIIGQNVQSMKVSDFKRSISFFSRHGIKKIKFAGGEPLLYKGLNELISYARQCGIEDIGINTNGVGLATKILELKENGLTSVSISLDSLKEYKFSALTGGANLKEVFLGIDACKSAGIDIKINCMAIKGFNDDELVDFMRMSINNNVDIRLVELMDDMVDPAVLERGYINLKEYMQNIEAIDFVGHDENSIGEYFKIEGAEGRVGIITKDSRESQEDLRRINITNRGYMNIGAISKNIYFVKSMLLNDEMMDNLLYKIKYEYGINSED